MKGLKDEISLESLMWLVAERVWATAATPFILARGNMGDAVPFKSRNIILYGYNLLER